MLFLTTLLVSIIVTIALMPYTRELACRLQAVDRPNQRKVHDQIMPKCGGMAIAIGAMMPILLWGPMTPFFKGLLIGSLIIVVFGIVDDIKELDPYSKLIGQLMAALAAIFIAGVKINDLGHFLPSGMILPDWLAIPLTIIVVIGVTNATNLSDGLDGLAGGIALLIYLCIGYLGIIEKDWFSVMVSIAVGGAVLGFLRFNSHPAQLFMGDAGSQFLGFIAILLSIRLTQQSDRLSVLLPLFILGVPILDTMTVMTKRMAKGRSPFSADKNHFHHQLMKIGLYHTEAVVTIYVAQSLLIIFAMVYHRLNDWVLLGIYLFFAGLVVGSFSHFERTSYRVNRDSFLNKIKYRLKPLKDRGQAIKVAFGIVKYGVPSLLLFNALFAAPENKTYLLILCGFVFLLFISWVINKQILKRFVKLCLYLLTPLFIYQCDQGLYTYFDRIIIAIYNFLYLILLAGVFLTLKLTRRTNGFKSSTLDFLVIFVILLIPNLPDAAVKGYHLGLVAVKTVILFYGYEVLIGEMRKRIIRLPLFIAIVMVFVKSFLVGW
jgi:UDP-GlcNAc:undecaprenyl-phosphate GlcNAc-1-phosphate transferase